VSPEIRKLIADEVIGVEVERFLSGEAGRRMTEQAEADRAAALEQLATVDPEDARAIRAIQTQIAAIDRFHQGLADMMTAARQASMRLTQLEQED
jgi:hypothetical protein